MVNSSNSSSELFQVPAYRLLVIKIDTIESRIVKMTSLIHVLKVVHTYFTEIM